VPDHVGADERVGHPAGDKLEPASGVYEI
jgi:hypothetical protein